MNVLNWIQQEQKIADYHVIKWPTSHFHHPVNRTDIVGQINMRPSEHGGPASGTMLQAEGMGFGIADHMKGQYKTGGLGTDGLVTDGVKDATDNKVMSTTLNTHGNQATGPEAAATVAQAILPAEMYSVVESARQSAIKIQNRIRQGTARLRDIYQKQFGHTEKTQSRSNTPRKQPEKEQRGTRHVTKDEVLFMQAENHYLLDSYDKNGQYSMLGK